MRINIIDSAELTGSMISEARSRVSPRVCDTHENTRRQWTSSRERIIRHRRRDGCISLPLVRSVTPREWAWCHGVLYFAYRRRMPIPRSTQQHFRNANATVFYGRPVTTVSDNEDDEDDDLRPGDRLCTPANRYTFYALRLVCCFRSSFASLGVSWACFPFVKLPVETLFLCQSQNTVRIEFSRLVVSIYFI